MKTRQQLICGWSGIILLIMFMTGFWFIAQFVPPHKPTMGASDLALSFLDNRSGILIGMTVYMMGVGFSFPFFSGVAVQMKYMEEKRGDLSMWTFAFLLTAVINMSMLFLQPCILWAAVIFRPDRSPELIQLVNDYNWFALVWPLTPVLVQYLSLGIVTLSSDGEGSRVFPRWVGFLNIWLAVLSLPAALVPFFMTGPFAWDGLFTFWLALTCFGGWVFVMSVVMLRAAKAGSTEASQEVSPPA